MNKQDKIIEVAKYFIKKSLDESPKDPSRRLDALKLLNHDTPLNTEDHSKHCCACENCENPREMTEGEAEIASELDKLFDDTEEKEEWEKEFDDYVHDEKLIVGHKSGEKGSPVFVGELEMPRFKNFIGRLLHKQREELVKEIEELDYDKYIDSIQYYGTDGEIGYDQALNDVIKLIKKHE